MVTVFLTDEAEDILLEEFAENGLPQMPDAEWTSDILIEYVDSGMTVRILKTEDVEGYIKTTRFFPPTLQEAEIEKPEIDEKALEECRYNLEEYLNEMNPVAVEEFALATDGDVLAYQPTYVLKRYKEEREEIVHAYLHMLFHGVLRHMFVHTLVDQDLWGLACDIAVEYVISGLGLKAATTHRELLQKSHYASLEKKAGKLTAEKLYRYFLDNPPDKRTLTELRAAFYADDHRVWFMTEAEKALLLGKAVSVTITEETADGNGPGNGGENESGNTEGGSLADAAMTVSELEERWTDISNRIQMDMETFSKLQGDKAGGLMQNLREVNREKYDYTSFLKKFAVRGEVMRVNDDEFDYIFYTYGLKLYKKVPLIEPLEYKEV